MGLALVIFVVTLMHSLVSVTIMLYITSLVHVFLMTYLTDSVQEQSVINIVIVFVIALCIYLCIKGYKK